MLQILRVKKKGKGKSKGGGVNSLLDSLVSDIINRLNNIAQVGLAVLCNIYVLGLDRCSIQVLESCPISIGVVDHLLLLFS